MLSGETIIYFGPEPWEGMWRNRHQLMTRLANRNRVVYVEPPAMLRPVLRGLVTGSPHQPRSAGSVRRDESGVIVYPSPAWTPLTGRPPLRGLSLRWYFRILRARCNIAPACRPIVWL